MEIEVGGKYKTRHGREVRIASRDPFHDTKFVGCMNTENYGPLVLYSAHGTNLGGNIDFDLVAPWVDPPKEITLKAKEMPDGRIILDISHLAPDGRIILDLSHLAPDDAMSVAELRKHGSRLLFNWQPRGYCQ